MIVATTPFIAGHRVTETKGQTFGVVVRSRGFSGNLIAGLRSIGGGEIKEYTSLLEDTRRQALDRLRAGRNDVGDRRLRHGGRDRGGRRCHPADRVRRRPTGPR